MAEADLIFHHGKVVTVDDAFSIREAMALEKGKIFAIGSNQEILGLRKAGTRVIDLEGKTVLPGLIDSHAHPSDASMTEFDHPIPDMETLPDVLNYVQTRAAQLPAGEWIRVDQVFITRLKEQRYPSKEELDHVAPRHPVIFATGPDASLNSLALKQSGITRDFRVSDGGPDTRKWIHKQASPPGSCAVVPDMSKAAPMARPPLKKTIAGA